jgi:hypothetical protein
MIWFVATVFGKIVLTIGPVPMEVCADMVKRWTPPVRTEIMILDGRIVTDQDVKPACHYSTRGTPRLGKFDFGTPT